MPPLLQFIFKDDKFKRKKIKNFCAVHSPASAVHSGAIDFTSINGIITHRQRLRNPFMIK